MSTVTTRPARLPLAAPTAADKAAALTRLQTMRANPPGIPGNDHLVFGKAAENVYRGRVPSAAEMQDLKTLGVTHLVSFLDPHKTPFEAERSLLEKSQAKALGLKVIHIPWSEHSTDAVIESKLARFLQRLAKLGNAISYIHCKHGENRTGFMAAGIGLEHGESSEAVLAKMDGFGYSESRFPNLKQLLKKIAAKAVAHL